jgi:alkylation response protein AidB-like acyl-CoA dehydrogenase
MDFTFTDEQEMLRTSARQFLAKECPSTYVRRMIDADDAWDEELWTKLAEIGWTALGIPEAYGGIGSFLDLVVVLEETGRALLPGPFFSTMCLAVPTMLEAGGEVQKQRVLGRIAGGAARATLALTEAGGRWDSEGVTLRAERAGDGWRLDGIKRFVPDAGVADETIVVARTGPGRESGITLFLISGRPEGMSVRPLSTMDMTRRWYEVELQGVRVPGDAVIGVVDEGWAPLRRALDWASAGLCAEMVGGADRVLRLSVEYAKTRYQFGKPIGTYQAVSHKLADMLLEIESGRSATYYAAWAMGAGASGASLAVSTAKACTSEAYRRAATNGIQVHGGLGFTWEHDMHLYFKRAKASELTLGDSTFHRELVARALDL